MMDRIDLQREKSISLADVVHYLPHRRGRKVHYSTVYRWATKGVRGRLLPTALVGGIRYTTLEALEQFVNAACSGPWPESSGHDLGAIDQALDDAGL